MVAYNTFSNPVSNNNAPQVIRICDHCIGERCRLELLLLSLLLNYLMCALLHAGDHKRYLVMPFDQD